MIIFVIHLTTLQFTHAHIFVHALINVTSEIKSAIIMFIFFRRQAMAFGKVFNLNYRMKNVSAKGSKHVRPLPPLPPPLPLPMLEHIYFKTLILLFTHLAQMRSSLSSSLDFRFSIVVMETGVDSSKVARPCDCLNMLSIANPKAFTNTNQHKLKQLTKI